MNKDETPSFSKSAETHLPSKEVQSRESSNHITVGRRSFIRGLGIVGATLLPGSALLMRQAEAQEQSSGRLTKGDADLLRFAAWAEIVESDLWTQYNELGGATTRTGGNLAYKLALQNLDGDMPQYITDNTDDELSHVAFLNAYLRSKGEEAVDLDEFRVLPSSRATGAKQIRRLTNLQKLVVDTSFFTRYRSERNADSGAAFAQAV